MAQDEPKDEGMDALGFSANPFSEAEPEATETPVSTESEEQTSGEPSDGGETPAETGDENGDEPAATDGEEEKPAEGEQKPEEKKVEPPATPTVPEELKAIFPEAKDAKAVAEAVTDLKARLDEREAANNEMLTILKAHPALIPMLKDVREGKPLYEAIRKAFELGEDEIPDPVKDPEGYDKHVRKQIELEERKKREEAERAAAEKRNEETSADALALAKDFQTEMKLDDAEMDKFRKHCIDLINGDPATGKLSRDFFRLMWRTYAYEKDIEKAKKDGEIAGRNDAIDKIVKKKDVRGDGIPALKSGQTRQRVVDELTSLEQVVAPQNSMFDV